MTALPGTKIVATDLVTGESDERVIVDDFCVVCDGLAFVAHVAKYANGTTVLTIKRHGAA